MRYLRLYWYFVQFSLTRNFEFRLNFWFRVIMDVVYALMLIVFYKILYGETSVLAGWSEAQMLVFVAGALIVDSAQMTLISDSLNSFPDKVRKGDVDYYLVRPVSALFFLTLRDLSPSSVVNFLCSCGIFVYYLLQLPELPSWSLVCWYLILLANGVILYYCTRLLFVLPSFWLGSVDGLNALFYNLYYTVDRPDRIFRGGVRLILTTILPFSVMVSFPTRVFFEGSDPLLVAQIFGTTLGMAAVIWCMWRACLRSYTSASS